jgi:hypothetical protein
LDRSLDLYRSYITPLQFSLWDCHHTHSSQFTVHSLWDCHHTHSSQSLGLPPHTTVHSSQSLGLPPHTTVHSSQSLGLPPHTQFTVHSLAFSAATATLGTSVTNQLAPGTDLHFILLCILLHLLSCQSSFASIFLCLFDLLLALKSSCVSSIFLCLLDLLVSPRSSCVV